MKIEEFKEQMSSVKFSDRIGFTYGTRYFEGLFDRVDWEKEELVLRDIGGVYNLKGRTSSYTDLLRYAIKRIRELFV